MGQQQTLLPVVTWHLMTQQPMFSLSAVFDLQARLNVLNQTRVLSGSDYRYGKASGLARDSSVTRQTRCSAPTALG